MSELDEQIIEILYMTLRKAFRQKSFDRSRTGLFYRNLNECLSAFVRILCDYVKAKTVYMIYVNETWYNMT